MQALLDDPQILILDEPTAGFGSKGAYPYPKPESRILSGDKIVLIATHVVSDIEFISKEILLNEKRKGCGQRLPGGIAEKNCWESI